MEPLPSINKAYSAVLRVEKQKEVNGNIGEDMNNALAANNQKVLSEFNQKEETIYLGRGMIEYLLTATLLVTLRISVLSYMGTQIGL